MPANSRWDLIRRLRVNHCKIVSNFRLRHIYEVRCLLYVPLGLREGFSFLMFNLSSQINKIMLVTLVAKGRRRNLRTYDFQGTENKHETDAFSKARNFRISLQWPSLCGNYRVQTSPREVFQAF